MVCRGLDNSASEDTLKCESKKRDLRYVFINKIVVALEFLLSRLHQFYELLFRIKLNKIQFAYVVINYDV